jgi:hypothetical protein
MKKYTAQRSASYFDQQSAQINIEMFITHEMGAVYGRRWTWSSHRISNVVGPIAEKTGLPDKAVGKSTIV